jgi:hypothetical protein
MYKSLIIAAVTLGVGCVSPSGKQQPSGEAKVMGADRDSPGCIGSAGYTWSALKRECIRPFEAGLQFKAYGSQADTTQAAYLVLSPARDSAEVFFALTDKPVLLVAVPRLEGDVTPVLFRNTEEQVDIVYSRDMYLVRYQNEPRFSRVYQAGDGLLQ